MSGFENKVVAYDTKGFWGGNVDPSQLENRFILLGDEGWELVNCTASNQSYGSSKSIVCIFKREKDR